MDVQPDFKELFELFNAQGVEYLIVGGHALAFHGAPRFTGDLDLLIPTDTDNATRVLSALKTFGFGSMDLSVADLTTAGRVVQLGVPPVRVDLLTSIDGVSWRDAWNGKEKGTYGGTPVYFIGRREFIANKRAARRLRDLGDLEALGEQP